jgi:hypothetical protein
MKFEQSRSAGNIQVGCIRARATVAAARRSTFRLISSWTRQAWTWYQAARLSQQTPTHGDTMVDDFLGGSLLYPDYFVKKSARQELFT